MEDVLTTGTGRPAHFDGMAQAGKSGTTSSNRDALFAGYTPYYTCVVWGGYDDNTELSYTFHGRDVYAYTGARLAAGVITYEEVGKELPLSDIVGLDVVETEYNAEEKSVKGCVDILDVRFGSLWTSISRDDFYQLNPEFGKRYEVSIFHENMLVYQNQVVYQHSFAEVPVGSTLLYINSVYRVGIAINQGSFARAYNVGTGTNWKIRIRAID